ncbi:hypothetical protein V1478_015889 [Vespula squamosa]|uniref:C2H2-type domain-containing protein n=1 Tax=Vespula squamosa TaxID=30214 RepID=A0ABD2A244_VESSQ
MGTRAKRKRNRMTVIDDLHEISNILTCRFFFFFRLFAVFHASSDYYKRLGRHFCSTCGKEYRWMQSLIRHEREECGKDPQHICPVCGTKIRHKWMLKKHLINVHEWITEMF